MGGASLSLVGRGAFEFAPTFGGRAMGEVLVYVEKRLNVHHLESNRERCWCCSKLEGLYTLLRTFECCREMCVDAVYVLQKVLTSTLHGELDG